MVNTAGLRRAQRSTILQRRRLVAADIQRLAGLALFAGGILAADVATGRYLQFPILFVIPVGLGSWYFGRYAGFAFALALVGSRFWIAESIELSERPIWEAGVNAMVRLTVLVGLAVLLAKVAEQRRALAARVEQLEGILPICMHCKRIRDTNGDWEQVEVYVRDRSRAQFSHALCEDCERIHYP